MTIGIYGLLFNNSNSVYIGKSRNIENRFLTHLSLLRREKHSAKVQDAYKAHGLPELIILERANEQDLYSLERYYIKEFDSIKNGLNNSPGGEAGNISPGDLNGRALNSNKNYIQVLELLVTTNLPTDKISKLTNVTESCVSKICSGEGHIWLAEAEPLLYSKLIEQRLLGRNAKIACSKRMYSKIFNPEGIEYDMSEVTLTSFCKVHNLTFSKVSGVLNGKIKQHKGWHCGKYNSVYLKPDSIVISPTGIEYLVKYGQYTKFALNNKLDPAAFNKLINNKTNQHHGWTLKND